MADQLIDALREIDHCEHAVIHLLSPSTELDSVRRERVALLLDYLRRDRERLLTQAAGPRAGP